MNAWPRDPALPQMAIALDESAMVQVFAGQLARQRPALTLEHCRVERIKYRPRRNLAVAYRLLVRDGGRAFEQRVAARFCHGGDAARRHAKALHGPLHVSATGLTVTHDVSLDMVAHWWPNDAKLAAASRLADDEALRTRWLPAVAAALGAPAQALQDFELQIVQAVPEHRVTARVALQLGARRETVFAKADAEHRGPSTQAVMQALWSGGARQAGRLNMPQPLLWQPESGLHWQRAVCGKALLDSATQVDATHSAQVGGVLAALHATPVAAARAWSLAELRERVHDVATVLALVQREWQPCVAALVVALARELNALAAMPWVTLHGDLHPRNLLLEGDTLTLIDFDSVRTGPAALDLGAWLADALYRALLAGADPASAMRSARAFIEAYEAAGGARLDERTLAWCTAYQLLCQRVWRCVVNLKPGRYPLVEPLLALAHTLLREGTVAAAPAAALEAA